MSSIDAAAIAKAVQSEIERQQKQVVYEDLSAEELEGVVAHLTERLALCKDALAAKTSSDAKAEPAALKATKVTGTWPELPWGGERGRRSN